MTIPDPEPVKLHINDFRLLLAEAYAIEHSLLMGTDLDDVDRFCVGLAATIKLPTFFEAKSIAWLSTTIFENIPVREFILSLDSRFFLLTNEEDIEETVRLARKLSNVCFYNTQVQSGTTTAASSSIMPQSVAGAYTRANAAASRKGNIVMLLADRWLMTTMLLLMNYTDAIADKKQETAQREPGKGRTAAATPRATRGQPTAAVTTTQR